MWQLNLATGQRTRLTSYPDWDEDDAPSPDGRSIVIEATSKHRVDALGALLPVRDFIDDPESAILAGYLVGAGGSSPDIAALRQCDLQPWLLRHPAIAAEPDGTAPALRRRAGARRQQRLRLPAVESRRHHHRAQHPELHHQSQCPLPSAGTPDLPRANDSGQGGELAARQLGTQSARYHGPLGGTNHVVLQGLRAGTATIDYDNVKGLFVALIESSTPTTPTTDATSSTAPMRSPTRT